LAERFESELDLPLAAAETGMPQDKFLRGLERDPRLAQRLGALRATGGTVQRQVFVECFEGLTDVLQIGISLPALNREISKCTEALRGDSRNAQNYYDRGHAYATKGDFDRALTDLNEAIRLESKRAAFFVERAWVHLSRKEYESSIADNTEAIRLEPANADALFNRAGAHAALGNQESATADYSEVIRLEPKNAAAYLNRGRAWARRGSSEKAARDFADAYSLDPSFLSFLKDGIQALVQDDQKNAAEQILEALIEKRSDDKEVRRMQTRIRLKMK